MSDTPKPRTWTLQGERTEQAALQSTFPERRRVRAEITPAIPDDETVEVIEKAAYDELQRERDRAEKHEGECLTELASVTRERDAYSMGARTDREYGEVRDRAEKAEADRDEAVKLLRAARESGTPWLSAALTADADELLARREQP